jgi:hypothetical protein
VARYTRSAANPNVANTTGVIMMTWTDPFSNHNGGWIDFGPDGNLYIAVGDGGSANDPNNAAQNMTSRLGKMHRIKPTVGGASPYYTIPAGNPFAGGVTTDVKPATCGSATSVKTRLRKSTSNSQALRVVGTTAGVAPKAR